MTSEQRQPFRKEDKKEDKSRSGGKPQPTGSGDPPKTTPKPPQKEPGGAINTLNASLNFSGSATSVTINLSELDSTVSNVVVSWITSAGSTTIFTTTTWNDPGLDSMQAACVVGTSNTLTVRLTYSNGAVDNWRKPGIFPVANGTPTVVLSKS